MLKRFFLHCLAAWFFVLCNIFAFPALAQENREYLIKAAFIVNFTKFIEWPADKAIARQTKLDVCVLGDNNLIASAPLFRQASTARLSISLVRESNVANAPSHCHILFIGTSDEHKLKDTLDALKSQPVLTVSDSVGFTEHGGMMGFVVDDGKVKLVVNKKAVETAGMYVDAQLLEVAFKVIDN